MTVNNVRTFVDLRSDTVTQPTPAMRDAMFKAQVGDDVYGEDPTVIELEALASRITGKESALFVASGTMGNVAATMVHTRRGDELVCGIKSHIYRNEQGAMASICGVQARTIDEETNGTLDINKIESVIQGSDYHHAITRVVAIENTHNMCGGIPLSMDYVSSLGYIVQKHGLKLHIDGARIFNASVALNVPVIDILSPADSVSICLSKGLGSPVGSVLCGNSQFIDMARRARKVLGGGLRQSGILAAAGIISLTEMIDRLSIDHQNARLLSDGFSRIPGIYLHHKSPATNMVYVGLKSNVPFTGVELRDKLKAEGILTDLVSEDSFRFVTHYGIDKDMVEKTIQVFSNALAD